MGYEEPKCRCCRCLCLPALNIPSETQQPQRRAMSLQSASLSWHELKKKQERPQTVELGETQRAQNVRAAGLEAADFRVMLPSANYARNPANRMYFGTSDEWCANGKPPILGLLTVELRGEGGGRNGTNRNLGPTFLFVL